MAFARQKGDPMSETLSAYEMAQIESDAILEMAENAGWGEETMQDAIETAVHSFKVAFAGRRD